VKKGPTKPVHCAIYTRVSTDHGLEQDFDSLDAQHDAAQAYIRSQAHAGWTLIRVHYDDGGYSGGSIKRPALQRLLADVRSRKVDIVVVYKVDRLTRSLADFAKLVELFDAHGVSFVSVTQQFNTTTSMGRLTLNVLLSFAQFEREVTSERIRDKIAASKRKGLWVGGVVPLGYATKVEAEAERVRTIFRRYLELGSLNRLMAELRERGIVTKQRLLKTGCTVGGIPFTRGPLAHFLRNRFYIGEVMFKGEVFPGEQPAILDRELFEAVQAKLDQQRNNHSVARDRSKSLLADRIYDDRGNRMSPSHVRKQGTKYRYYLSSPLLHGRPERAGTVPRVPATEVEALVGSAVREHVEMTGKPLIESDRVEGTAVYDPQGTSIGSIKRLMIEKVSGKVAYAVMSFGGFLGMGSEEHAVPWNKLTYDTNLGGYRTDITEQQLRGAPAFSRDRAYDWTNRRREEELHDYYEAPY
jgi:DNA invertase Pin-like site-specific DNA recombinase